MCIFKSSMNRFEKVVKDVPGPAAYKYSLSNIACSREKVRIKNKILDI